jgi:glycosyltransferase involved in cell wall biosynthesis
MKVSIIIPVYNEERYIGETIEKINSVKLPDGINKEIIVIDDGSTDATCEILKKHQSDGAIEICRINKNMGKSKAVALGIKKSKGDIVLIQDSDLEYSPDNYIGLITPIIDNKADVVYGSRFKGNIKNMALINRIANIFSNITINLLYNVKLSDINTGHKAFRKKIFDKIKITSNRFVFETEITAKLLNLGYKIYEVPISYEARSREDGKKMTWLSAIQMYLGIIKYRLNINSKNYL